MNVPSDVDDMVRVLPRTFAETEVVQVRLKRKATHSAALFSETVRPAKIKAALEHLMTTPLYQQEGIKVSYRLKMLYFRLVLVKSGLCIFEGLYVCVGFVARPSCSLLVCNCESYLAQDARGFYRCDGVEVAVNDK